MQPPASRCGYCLSIPTSTGLPWLLLVVRCGCGHLSLHPGSLLSPSLGLPGAKPVLGPGCQCEALPVLGADTQLLCTLLRGDRGLGSYWCQETVSPARHCPSVSTDRACECRPCAQLCPELPPTEECGHRATTTFSVHSGHHLSQD